MTENVFLSAARAGQNHFWRYFVTFVLIMLLVITSTACMAGVAIAATGDLDIFKLPLVPLLAINLLPFGTIILGLWIGLAALHQRRLMSIINPGAGRFLAGRFFLGAGLWLLLTATADLILSLSQPGNYVFHFDPAQFLPYLLVGLLLIPIQAGAEEMLFRGYLTQAFGLAGGWWVAWLVPSVSFGLLHAVNPEVGAYGMLLTLPIYIGLGLLLGWITLRSGSLELALGLHVANNLYAALLVGYPSAALPSGALFQIQQYDPQLALLVGLIQILAFLLLFEFFRRATVAKARLAAPLMLLVVLAGLLAGCTSAQQASGAAAPGEPSIPLEDCSLRGLEMTQIKARCGTLRVPENPEDPAGRSIDLRVVVVKAVSRAPAPDPLFLLAGGPGQAASEAFTSMLPALERLRFQRDIILVDQRGTGQSNPLDCDDPERPGDDQVVGVEVSLEETLTEVRQCRASLTGDPRFYTTEYAMRDLDAVRQVLGYQQVNLLGLSYGTRAALTYQRLYPEHTRSLILDGVVPPEWPLGAQLGADAQRALDMALERCAADPTCQSAFPDLRLTFQRIIEQARSQPVEVEVAHPTSGKPTRVRMTPEVVGSVVRLMIYSDTITSLLPLSIYQAGQGDYRMLASQYMVFMNELDEGISHGMYYSVVCAEDTPYLPEEILDESFIDYDVERVRAICQAWLDQPPAPVNENPGDPDLPVLILSGELDPVTPPHNGDRLVPLFPNSQHLVLDGKGHGNFYVGCVPEILYRFIDTADPKNLDTRCTTKINPAPFFTSPAGPQP